MQINNIKKLLKIKGNNVNILNFYETNNEIIVDISVDVTYHSCPKCKTSTKKVHDYRKPSFIKHCSIYDKIVFLRYKKRRYVCQHCNARFTESNPFVSKYAKVSNFTRLSIINNCSRKISFSDVANLLHISTSTVYRHFINHTSFERPDTLPEVLCIDESVAHMSSKLKQLATNVCFSYWSYF